MFGTVITVWVETEKSHTFALWTRFKSLIGACNIKISGPPPENKSCPNVASDVADVWLYLQKMFGNYLSVIIIVYFL